MRTGEEFLPDICEGLLPALALGTIFATPAPLNLLADLDLELFLGTEAAGVVVASTGTMLGLITFKFCLLAIPPGSGTDPDAMADYLEYAV